jgi:hypothetical protein
LVDIRAQLSPSAVTTAHGHHYFGTVRIASKVVTVEFTAASIYGAPSVC